MSTAVSRRNFVFVDLSGWVKRDKLVPNSRIYFSFSLALLIIPRFYFLIFFYLKRPRKIYSILQAYGTDDVGRRIRERRTVEVPIVITEVRRYNSFVFYIINYYYIVIFLVERERRETRRIFLLVFLRVTFAIIRCII